jgi:hypothetical protein
MDERRQESVESGSLGAMCVGEYWYCLRKMAVPCTLAELDCQPLCGFDHLEPTDSGQFCVCMMATCAFLQQNLIVELFPGFQQLALIALACLDLSCRKSICLRLQLLTALAGCFL